MSRRTNFCIELDRIKKYAQSSDDKEQLDAVNEVINFVKSGSYIKRKNADEVLSCWGMTDKEASAELNLSTDNIRLIRQKISDALYDRLGTDFISLLSSGDASSRVECRRRLRVVRENKRASDFIPAVLIKVAREDVPDVEFNSIRDCKPEFDFLNIYNFATFKEQLSKLDRRKVAYLLRVLNQESGSLVDTDTMRQLMSIPYRESRDFGSDHKSVKQPTKTVGKSLSLKGDDS